jgi:adenosine deaminase
MDRFVQGLIVLLRDMHADELLSGAKMQKDELLFNESAFAAAFVRRFSCFSENEARNTYNVLQQRIKETACKHAGILGLMYVLADFFFVPYKNKMRCHHEKFIDWRDATREIGQIPFICAWLAEKDLRQRFHRQTFTFHPNVKTDDYRLQQLLSVGIAENHYHLYPSAPVFNMAWICLMNHICGRKREFEELNPTFFAKELNLHDAVSQAAAIRVFLWGLLESNTEPVSKTLECQLKLKSLAAPDIQSFINKYRAGVRRGHGYVYDYITPPAPQENHIYAPFAGENYFLYRIFYRIFENDEAIVKYSRLFLFYLMVSFHLRNELIQCNDAVGFQNFKRYQDRKDIFIDNAKYKPYFVAFERMAVEAPFQNHPITILEARFSPNMETKSRIRKLLRSKKMKPWEQCTRAKNCPSRKESYCHTKGYYCEFYENKLRLIPHVPKNADKINKKTIQCRHSKYRKYTVAPMIKYISKLREDRGESSVAKFLSGLDTCSQEIGCRPEVFAPAFRKARQDPARNAPPLRITYHVGEDFLDLADGLRAIDEAMLFLKMQNADRFGHALALGVNVKEWYQKKEMQICLPRQDLIDNAAWLYVKAQEFGASSDQIYMFELEKLFWEQFRKVWDVNLDVKKKNIHILDYFKAWKLRDNDPESIDSMDDNLDRWLYHRYHYDAGIKERGAIPEIYRVSENYVSGVAQIQIAMQRKVARNGISIECNPTSNYLIGTFRSYEHHPIFNLNAHGLPAFGNTPRLHVSINTDDQGVFDTDLESEYALLSCALTNMRNETGQPTHKMAEIYDWIENVRKMGIEQSFKSLEHI